MCDLSDLFSRADRLRDDLYDGGGLSGAGRAVDDGELLLEERETDRGALRRVKSFWKTGFRFNHQIDRWPIKLHSNFS
jgi:hypothetical protein